MNKYRNLYYVLSQQKKKVEGLPYLTMQSDTQFQFRVYNNTKNWDGILEYSLDTINWTTFTGTSVDSTASGTIYLRGTGNTVIVGASSRQFVFTNATNLRVIGNIETLLDWQLTIQGVSPVMATNCYFYMFYGCTSLTTAPELPATALTTSCYSYMFRGCTSLTTAPELPATALTTSCYSYMFYGCTSLTTAPELPATTLESSCYYRMFRGCTSLKVSNTKTEETKKEWRIPTIGEITKTPASWSADMLYGTGGTFKSDPSANTTYYISE